MKLNYREDFQPLGPALPRKQAEEPKQFIDSVFAALKAWKRRP